MIRLDEIKSQYPPHLHGFSLGILREYLQYKILEAIFSSKFGHKLVLMGGTALRIVYSNPRFSEDLDFDNHDLSKEEFEELSQLIKKSLEREGYEAEVRNIYKKAFHCYIKIPEILYKEGLSNLPDQKITIRVDTTAQDYKYTPNIFLLDAFGVYQNIRTVPLELLLAQKFAAVLERKRAKGRDFFDISYLLSREVKPDMKYVSDKLQISNKTELRKVVINHIDKLDLFSLTNDVKQFLFTPSHISRIINIKKQLVRRLA